MILINLEARIKNKAFWLGLISWVILLCQVFGFDATTIIPKNYVDIFNVIFGFLGYLGIQTDTSTVGFSDSIISNATVQAINQADKVKTEGTTTSINNTVTENSQDTNIDNSASSKIIVDNPDNIQAIGATVNSVSATTPQ